MSRRFTVLAILFGASFLTSHPVIGQDMIAVNWFGDVFQIDSYSGAGAKIGNIGLGDGVNSMGVSPTGQVVVSQRVKTTTPASFLILRLDPVTGAVLGTLAQSTYDVRALAYDPSGVLFAIADHSTTASGFDELLRIDLPAGTFISVGATGRLGMQGFAISAAGMFYVWDIGDSQLSAPAAGLMTINPLTGLATDVNPNVGPVGGSAIQFLSFRQDGALIGGRETLFQIDPQTGLATPIGSNGINDLRGGDFPLGCAFSYGVGCAGSGGFVPGLTASGCPVANMSMSVTIDQALGGSTAILALGLAQGSTPLMGNCSLNVTPLLPALLFVPLGGVGPGNGSVTISAPIPPSGAGVKFTVQALVIDAGVPRGFSATRGLELNIP